MGYFCLEIQNKTLEILRNDSVLSEYVKNFGIGGERTSRIIFPYVAVSGVTRETAPLCIGPGAPDTHHFRIIIRGGTNHLLPHISREGGSGKKGIVQLMDDIVAAVYPGTIGGLFKPTMHLVSASFEEVRGTGGRSWQTSVELGGNLKSSDISGE